MAPIRVGVMRGGLGAEYDVSLRTGQSVLEHLPEDYRGHDLLITKDGTWHLGGLPIRVSDVAKRVDVVFNSLHGEFGEDGKVQRILEDHCIPYTGSGVVASALGMNKHLA